MKLKSLLTFDLIVYINKSRTMYFNKNVINNKYLYSLDVINKAVHFYRKMKCTA